MALHLIHKGDLNSSGIRTPYVNKQDIEALLKCVSDFIQFSLDEHNKQVRIWANCYQLKNNKIYEYDFIDKNKIESIYAIGDILNIKTVVNNVENDFDMVTIDKIDNTNIVLNNGHVIDFKSIVYISNEPTSEMLKYKEDEIATEFLNILSNEEKEEFKQCNIELLLIKYKLAIIDRTWMCRDEHDFNIDYHSGNMVDKVTPIVKNIINTINLVFKYPEFYLYTPRFSYQQNK